jgi:GNAT superfamily N-acetyltransferase
MTSTTVRPHRPSERTPAPPLLPTAGGAIEVERVRSHADLDDFIRFQLALYQEDPYFVPPIVAERRDFLDRRKNPFFSHAEVELYLARRNGRVVGRIAAIDDALWNQFHNAETGFFGMFDAPNDPDIARALLDAAAAFARSRGMKMLSGPVNLSTNHDCGALVDGFEFPPAMMMPYNFRYYGALLEGWGLRKMKDLYAYDLSTAMTPPEKVVRVAERLRDSEFVRVRPVDVTNLPEEIRRLKSIYNAMLDRNWLFLPMNEEEFDSITARLRPLVRVRPELCLIAEVKGEPVAFSLTLPDSNRAIRAANGQLTRWGFPIGLMRMAWAARDIDRLRVLLFGIKPGYRRRGLDALLYLETIRTARRLGYDGAELGWTTEDNELMNRAIESMGARRYKTYRIYEKALQGS